MTNAVKEIDTSTAGTAGPRVLAMYLPQFHPIPENDEWWGRGFTEWSNVASTRRLFKGHYQPHVPADLGFYDLRLADTREAQAELARRYGIDAFCYYHYWFEGRRLLERPVDDVLASGRPDFPFCLCWANETWSRRWLGEERNILIEQTYSPQDDVRHARWLIRAFEDRRYVTVHGRALFLVYRPRHLPDPRRTTDTLREECIKAGLADPYLVGVDAHSRNFDPRAIGFDDSMNFAPQLGVLDQASLDGFNWRRLLRNAREGVLSGRLKVHNYERAWRAMVQARPSFRTLPSVFVGWDNTPRRGRNGIIVIDATPAAFEDALTEAIASVRHRHEQERIVFVNAWNEWAEGNHLEPDLANGHAYLEVIERVRREQAPEAVIA
jgi:lipopolysaccharide biosynthesis protein